VCNHSTDNLRAVLELQAVPIVMKATRANATSSAHAVTEGLAALADLIADPEDVTDADAPGTITGRAVLS
jgi:hypothetical protein